MLDRDQPYTRVRECRWIRLLVCERPMGVRRLLVGNGQLHVSRCVNRCSERCNRGNRGRSCRIDCHIHARRRPPQAEQQRGHCDDDRAGHSGAVARVSRLHELQQFLRHRVAVLLRGEPRGDAGHGEHHERAGRAHHGCNYSAGEASILGYGSGGTSGRSVVLTTTQPFNAGPHYVLVEATFNPPAYGAGSTPASYALHPYTVGVTQ